MNLKDAVSYLLAGSLIVTSAALVAQDKQVWVNVVINGKVAGGFLAATARPSEIQPRVSSDVSEVGARTKDGLPIRAFEFAGWREGERIRVLVFAIVQTDERASRVRGYDGPGFKRVEFDDLRIKVGEEVIISKMKGVGVVPWVLKAVSKEVK